MEIFLYNIGDIVYFLNGHKISKGVIVGRKFVDAPEWKDSPAVVKKDYNNFDRNGNLLGRSCEMYEIKFVDGTSSKNVILDVHRIEPSPQEVVDKLLNEINE